MVPVINRDFLSVASKLKTERPEGALCIYCDSSNETMEKLKLLSSLRAIFSSSASIAPLSFFPSLLITVYLKIGIDRDEEKDL